MAVEPKLSVTFDTPSNGWLAVDVRAGDQRVRESFSHIYPSLADLCSALCNLVSGAPSRPAVLCLEPSELEMLFGPEADGMARVTIHLHPDHRRTGTGRLLFEHRGSAESIVMTFWRALRRLQTALPPGQFAERFREPFPETEMNALTRLVSNR